MTMLSYNPFLRDGTACAAALDHSLPITFAEHPVDTIVTVSHSLDTTGEILYKRFQNPQLLHEHLEAIRNSKLKIISISSEFSYGRLRITKETLQKIVRTHDVSLHFANVVLAFGEPPRTTEQGYGFFSNGVEADESFAMSYLYRFVQRDGPKAPWKPRQIGVYHAKTSTDSHFFILVQPHGDEESAIAQQLAVIREQNDAREALLKNPFRLHEVLIGTYFDGWRWYLRELGKDFQKQCDKVFTARINTNRPFSVNFDILQHCKDLSDRVIPLSATFSAILRIIGELRAIEVDGGTITGQRSALKCHESLVLATKSSTDAFEQRIEGVIEMAGSELDLKNQRDSARVNDHLLKLTLHTVDDSATVRVITIVTLFYLPASFIGTIFGMNLFSFNAKTRRVMIARDFWLYVVVFVPLTIFTFVLWGFLARRATQRREKEKERRGLSEPPVQ